MLVLRRKPGESIVMNGVIKIYVLAVEGDRVKIGIDAPPDVVIVRTEIMGREDEHGALPPLPPTGMKP
jgi:carbon storage regulator